MLASRRFQVLSSISRQIRQSYQFNTMQSVKQAFSGMTGVQINYKLKGLTSLELENGELREVEVEGVEGGKVLLTKLNDRVHAMTPHCTHYGAPLQKGVLSPDGYITCPWHGACFNIETGDVEDAPALDDLVKFPVFEEKGGVYITGDESTIKAMRRRPDVKCAANKTDEEVLIAGGGAGAFSTIQSLRVHGFKGKITVIVKEGYLPIDRTKLSKALISDPHKVELRPEQWYAEAGVDLVDDEVVKVEFEKKTVITKSGKHYTPTKFVIATGSIPKTLPLPGFKDLGNIFVLRTVDDVKGIVGAIGDKGKKIVVIGSSFIGLEVANALSKENSVTVVGMEKQPMERIMGEEVGAIIRNVLEKNGVAFCMSSNVEEALPSTKDPAKVGAVQLKSGTTLPADLVILGVGVSPATQFLKESGVMMGADGSLVTRETFAVVNTTDVYAIGDIAQYPYYGPGGNGTMTRIEHWNVAQNSGRSVGAAIARGVDKAKIFIPIFWSALGTQLRYCGSTPNGWDDVLIKGDRDNAKFVAYYCKNDTVVAVASMQMDPIVSKCAVLMRRHEMPTKSQLNDGIDPLKL